MKKRSKTKNIIDFLKIIPQQKGKKNKYLYQFNFDIKNLTGIIKKTKTLLISNTNKYYCKLPKYILKQYYVKKIHIYYHNNVIKMYVEVD